MSLDFLSSLGFGVSCVPPERSFLSRGPVQERGDGSPPMKEEELIALIDDVLRDDDRNNDGYIDYAEFARSLQ